MNQKGVHPIDVMVGTKVRHFRTLRGMSQEALGEIVGVTFQQVQKYEKGSNRISASRLVQIAQGLQVDVRLFFDGIDSTPQVEALAPMEQISRLAHQMGALMDKLPNQKVKASMIALIKAVAKDNGAEDDGAAV
jgi:transcriptional regulator with XRE-family HTH domain